MLFSRRKINLMYDWIIKNIDSNGVINDFEVIHEDFPWKDMGNILCRNKNAR